MKKIRLKSYIILSAFFFLSAILTFAYHYERYTFRLAGCSICSIKYSTSLSVQKINIDPPSAIAVPRPWPGATLPATYGLLSTEEPVYIPSLFSFSLFNKAPPVIA